jgi:hypothetical protein
VAQLGRRVQNGWEKAPNLAAEDRLVLLAPFLGPMIRVGIATAPDQRGGDHIAQDRVIGPVAFERFHPAEALLDVGRLEVLGWRSHRIADDAKHQARQSAGFKPAGIVG